MDCRINGPTGGPSLCPRLTTGFAVGPETRGWGWVLPGRGLAGNTGVPATVYRRRSSLWSSVCTEMEGRWGSVPVVLF
ncbi:hypothetical protein HanXRQr2_Chr17g0815471 [Helianthus annuus]|uniref:Uncharacterized protein n=1 Tax=Helianthus annuus TaxID=4232 RepID=A0A9K3GW52_HELAN|nr:hypothetical protein HanXRQr2_Chr17g0815471 [Helianthus annuus]KAJ0814230.1 hypothetical protein HanPSC8_Chr17g0783171 [Helianthus annuus]